MLRSHDQCLLLLAADDGSKAIVSTHMNCCSLRPHCWCLLRGDHREGQSTEGDHREGHSTEGRP